MTDTTPTPGFAPRLRSFWQSDVAWSFRHSPVAMMSFIVVLLMVFSAVFCSADRTA